MVLSQSHCANGVLKEEGGRTRELLPPRGEDKFDFPIFMSLYLSLASQGLEKGRRKEEERKRSEKRKGGGGSKMQLKVNLT